jgi:hypothetical protein
MDKNIELAVNYIVGFMLLIMGVFGYLSYAEGLLVFTPLGMMVLGATVIFVSMFLTMKQNMGAVGSIVLAWVIGIIMVINMDVFFAWGLLPSGGTTLGLIGMAYATKNTKYEIPNYMVGLPSMSEGNWAGVGKFCCFALVIMVLLSALSLLLFGVSIIIPWG